MSPLPFVSGNGLKPALRVICLRATRQHRALHRRLHQLHLIGIVAEWLSALNGSIRAFFSDPDGSNAIRVSGSTVDEVYEQLVREGATP